MVAQNERKREREKGRKRERKSGRSHITFFDLALETTYCHFYHSPSAEAMYKGLPTFKRQG